MEFCRAVRRKNRPLPGKHLREIRPPGGPGMLIWPKMHTIHVLLVRAAPQPVHAKDAIRLAALVNLAFAES